MPIDIAKPIVSKNADGDPVITLSATKDGKPFLTIPQVIYHGMSSEHLASLGAMVDAFFTKVKHTGLSDKEFGKWEDKAYDAISKFREDRHGGKK